ncbi:MAG TPA: T9SS type A sorting domain-containing protein [Saprospiraceae bacterium]|nr:T9SS type A sorting domain-containing protein [Saprospiraceae bacterium]
MQLKNYMSITCYGFLAFFTSTWNHLDAQQVIIQNWDGTELNYPIGTVRNLTLPESEVQLAFYDGSRQSVPLNDVRKIYFEDASTRVGVVETHTSIVCYPNPVLDAVNISNLPDHETQISIYRMDGSLVQTRTVNGINTQLDLTLLTSGLYLLKVQDQAFKIVKL